MNGTDGETQASAPAASGTGGAGVSSPASLPAVDVEEYNRLRDFYGQATQQFAALEPVADDVRWLLEDESNRDFIRQARKTYEESKAARAPQLSPDAQAMIDAVKPALEYVSTQQKREQDAVRAQQAEFARKTRTARDALVSQKPWLAENNDAGIWAIAAFGDRLGITDLSEAAKAFDAAGQPKGATPPRSLRGEAAAAGVPGPSALPPIKSPKDLRARIKHAFANQGR